MMLIVCAFIYNIHTVTRLHNHYLNGHHFQGIVHCVQSENLMLGYTSMIIRVLRMTKTQFQYLILVTLHLLRRAGKLYLIALTV